MKKSRPDAYTSGIARRQMREYARERDRMQTQSGREHYSLKIYLLDRWMRGE